MVHTYIAPYNLRFHKPNYNVFNPFAHTLTNTHSYRTYNLSLHSINVALFSTSLPNDHTGRLFITLNKTHNTVQCGAYKQQKGNTTHMSVSTSEQMSFSSRLFEKLQIIYK